MPDNTLDAQPNEEHIKETISSKLGLLDLSNVTDGRNKYDDFERQVRVSILKIAYSQEIDTMQVGRFLTSRWALFRSLIDTDIDVKKELDANLALFYTAIGKALVGKGMIEAMLDRPDDVDDDDWEDCESFIVESQPIAMNCFNLLLKSSGNTDVKPFETSYRKSITKSSSLLLNDIETADNPISMLDSMWQLHLSILSNPKY